MAFTEFYCQLGGSNLNAGSTQVNTAIYTSTNGNFNGSTTFTPTDATNPVSAGVAVGMWASIYIDGATVAVCTVRITAVTNASNGAITVSTTALAGTVPVTSATARTIKVGGAWLGPNAGSGFPLSMTLFRTATNAAGNFARVNLKNDQTYSISATITEGSNGQNCIVEGYTTTPGDGGKATIDGSTNAIAVYTQSSNGFSVYVDLIFASSATTGTNAVFASFATAGIWWIRCVFHGGRGEGLRLQANYQRCIECEIYDCNKSNTAGQGAFFITGPGFLDRCISHDNAAGVNAHGVYVSPTGTLTMTNCILDSNAGSGVNLNGSFSRFFGCDFYNNTGDGIKQTADGGTGSVVYIENCNFIKNGGKGVNNAGAAHRQGFIYNCGYGAGTQANGSANALDDWQEFSAVTYGSNLTPWVDPANGDFRVSLAAANWGGRASFTQTAASYAGSVGYPDIGAVQSKTGTGGTFSKEVSYGFA